MGDKSAIGMSRLLALRQRIETIAHNVANQTTTGFKREGLIFREHLTKAKEADEAPAMPMRSEVSVSAFTDFSPGPFRSTGSPTDVAIVGDGFFVVQTEGGERYTRNGSFTLDPNGRLVTLAGEAVLTANGPLQVSQRDGQISFAADGTISTALGQIGRLRLVRFDNATQVKKEGGNLFSSGLPAGDIPASQVQLVAGALEGSNVNAVGEISELIAASRAYEDTMKIIVREDDPRELRKLSGQDM